MRYTQVSTSVASHQYMRKWITICSEKSQNFPVCGCVYDTILFLMLPVQTWTKKFSVGWRNLTFPNSYDTLLGNASAQKWHTKLIPIYYGENDSGQDHCGCDTACDSFLEHHHPPSLQCPHTCCFSDADEDKEVELRIMWVMDGWVNAT